MTDHPLTDEKCEDIAHKAQWAGDIGDVVFRHCDMRAAYDKGQSDRLEQVIEWISANLSEAYIYVDFSGAYVIDEEKFVEDLKKAMRPQEHS